MYVWDYVKISFLVLSMLPLMFEIRFKTNEKMALNSISK